MNWLAILQLIAATEPAVVALIQEILGVVKALPAEHQGPVAAIALKALATPVPGGGQ